MATNLRGVYFRHGTPTRPPARGGRNAAYDAALALTAQPAQGRPSRKQSRRVTARIQGCPGRGPAGYSILIRRCDPRLQVVVYRSGSVVGNAGVFHLQPVGLSDGRQVWRNGSEKPEGPF